MGEWNTQDVPKRAATGFEIEFAVGIINYAAVEPEIGSRQTGEGRNDVLGGDIRNGNRRINF